MQKFYSIGEFSRLSQVSVKALRFYESVGLLTPARVDETTGYRYYSAAELPVTNSIVTLRATGMSLTDISSTLASGSGYDLSDALRRQHQALLQERQRLDQRLALVETLICGNAAPGNYRLISVDPTLAIHKQLQPSDDYTISRAFEELERTASVRGARAPSAPFCEILADGQWRACVPVTDDAGDEAEAEFIGAIGVACSLSYVGAYTSTEPLLKQMQSWLQEKGMEAIGPAREIYHRFGANQIGYALPRHVLAAREELYVTELQLTVELEHSHNA